MYAGKIIQTYFMTFHAIINILNIEIYCITTRKLQIIRKLASPLLILEWFVVYVNDTLMKVSCNMKYYRIALNLMGVVAPPRKLFRNWTLVSLKTAHSLC